MSQTIFAPQDSIDFLPQVFSPDYMRHGKFFSDLNQVTERFVSVPNDVTSTLFEGLAAGSIIDAPEGSLIGTSPDGNHDYALLFVRGLHFTSPDAGILYMNSDINIYDSGSSGRRGVDLIENFVNLIAGGPVIRGEQPMRFGQ